MGADAPVHVKDSDFMLLGKIPAYLLVICVFERAGRSAEIEGEKRLFIISNRLTFVFAPKIFDNVGTAEVSGRTDIKIHPDNRPRFHLF